MRRGAEKTDLLTIPHFERSEQNNRAAIADVLAVAMPRGILLCLGRYAEHPPFVVRFGWLSCGVMKPEWSLRNGAKITSQVSADGRAESSPFQGGVRHGGVDAGKFLRRHSHGNTKTAIIIFPRLI